MPKADTGTDYLILWRTADPQNEAPYTVLAKPRKADDDVALPLSFRASSAPAARRLAAKSPALRPKLGTGRIDLVAVPLRSWSEKLGAGLIEREPQLDV